MYKVDTGCNIYESIGFDYPGEEALKLMSNEEKKAVYLEGIFKISNAINILACFPLDSKRSVLLWTLQSFKYNFTKILNELGVSKEEIDTYLKEEKEKNIQKKKV